MRNFASQDQDSVQVIVLNAQCSAQSVKNPPTIQETWVQSLENKWQPTAIVMPGKSHGQRNWLSTVQGVIRVEHD